MALIKCPECGKEVSDKAQTCPNCGIAISELFARKVPVTFSREQKFAGNAVEGRVFIDNVEVGTINNGEKFTTQVTVGIHSITIDAGLSQKSIKRGWWLGTNNDLITGRNTTTRSLTIDDDTGSVFVTCAVRDSTHIDAVDIKKTVAPQTSGPSIKKVQTNDNLDWIDDGQNFVKCPQCGKRMSIDYIKARRECPDCGCLYSAEHTL